MDNKELKKLERKIQKFLVKQQTHNNFQFLGASFNLKKVNLFKSVRMPKNIIGIIEDFSIIFRGKKPKGEIELKINNMYVLRGITSSTNGIGQTRLQPFESLDIHVIDSKNQKIDVYITGRIKQWRGRPTKNIQAYFSKQYELSFND